ncbi:hypothetical protein [Candidatus Burkholderia verschuerenii]|uniref:hypothetical protein n=1 Tax=Candidatus Burkholderia verschuerenii TaxID=242163 RepID=UPI001E2C1648|nr:hypothetical protein [Candidatus Burkholderia verschuerenii]
MLFRLVDTALSLTDMANGEGEVQLHSIIVHETDTGSAQCFRDDAENLRMGRIDLDAIVFSPAITRQWRDPDLMGRLTSGERRANFPPELS